MRESALVHGLPSSPRGIFFALGLLTRLPVPLVLPRPADHRWALVSFPLVGAVVGAAATLVAWAMTRAVGSPPLVVGALWVATVAYATRGLHLDGLADLADGLSGGLGDRARTLAIMRDSRIGAHGAAALVLLLLVKSAASAGLAEQAAFAAMLLGPIAARAALVVVVVVLPYVRADGLGRDLSMAARPWCAAMAVGLAAATCHVTERVVSLAAALVAGFVVAAMARARIGGATGDVYGAVVEVAETSWLVVAAGGMG